MEKFMRYTDSPKFKTELSRMELYLSLVDYRQSTIEGYLQTLFECCEWLDKTYHVSINDADLEQLQSFLVFLHKPVDKGGRGLKPRSVNVYNVSIRRYRASVMHAPIPKEDLPLMKVDHVLPKVPTRQEVQKLIKETKNPRNRMILALAFGCALRLNEVLSLRFGDISFKRMQVTIRAEVSKNRDEGKVELPKDLANMIYLYYKRFRQGAKSEDYLFPGKVSGQHLSDGAAQRFFQKRMKELGWENRGYHFHSLRHAHALFYYQSGADLFQVQVRLRHRSIASTMIYVQLDGQLQERKKVGNPFDGSGFEL